MGERPGSLVLNNCKLRGWVKESWVGPGHCWAQLGHWGTAAGQTHGHVEAATAPTCRNVPSWHPLSPLGSARGAPLGTTMLDWARVGTSCHYELAGYHEAFTSASCMLDL